ncbi:helix-turn-helix transcriptional regulator [Thermobifida halotolerans]|uniref:Helix-turn-helix transcriptional regulator n=1 Tax=Thermobifida halotolerans TaxID=483545 RepID=A0A399G4U4_9ACTN|nr:helix-turn-helix transcriptional regulator [Thermobifida halotolerans]UOE20806.1 helix-turn-helix transcriptional regulator [Thermobifida halotolerans]
MSDRVRHATPEPPADHPDEPLLRHLIGDALRRARRERGLTLREVAEASQVSLPYLSEIERGRKEPSSEVLAAVYRALDLRLADLLGDVTDRLSLISAPVDAPAARRVPSSAAPRALVLAA